MPIKNSLLIFISLFSFNACTHPGHVQPSSSAAKLTEASLYNIDSIRFDLSTASASDSELANDEYKEAIAERNVEKSIEAFKTSVTNFPTAVGYAGLGNALVVIKNYKEALQAYRVASLLNYQPMYEIMYNNSAVYSMLPDTGLCADKVTRLKDSFALHYMEVALQMGYPKPENFLKDPAFNSLKLNNDWQFKTIYQTAK